jgi:hypothetical protein
MAAMSDYLENKIIDYIFRGTTTAFNPTTVYVGLHTGTTTDAGGGTEVSGGAYARIQVGPADASWTNTAGGVGAVNSGTGGLTDNAADITFVTASASWGIVTHVGIWDAVTGGNLLFHGALTASKTVDNGDTFKFTLGDLDITLA